MQKFPAAALFFLALTGTPALAASCPGNPDALGVSRTLVVDPTEHARIGTMQYQESLPLADKEVVLTFDDGPLPPYSTRVLETLASECVKATYFLVGRMAKQYPEMVRRIYNDGHTVGTHSQNHPLTFHRMPLAKAEQEIEEGIAWTGAALGDRKLVAPFFRIPGLLRAASVEQHLASQGLMTWSADFPADDWRHISASEVMRRALERLEAKGKGVLLLHDIQPATVLALPELLRELKRRGYKIVHVEAAGPDRPKTVTEPVQWVMRAPSRPGWPVVLPVAIEPPAISAPSALSFGFPHPFGAKVAIPIPASFAHEPAALSPVLVAPSARMRRAKAKLIWPHPTVQATVSASPALPGPNLLNFTMAEHAGPRIVIPASVAAAPAAAAVRSTAQAAMPAKRELADEPKVTHSVAAVPIESPSTWARIMRWFR